jgi:hypothetical protein
MDLLFEESDLTFVIVSEPEISVSDNAFSGNANYLRYFRHSMGSGLFLVVADKVVPFGNKQMANLEIGDHAANDIPVWRMFNGRAPGERSVEH